MFSRHWHHCVLIAATATLVFGCRPAEKDYDDRRGSSRFISLTGEGSLDATSASTETLDPEAFDEALETLPEELPETDGEESLPEMDGKLAKVCSELVGVPVKRVKVVGNQSTVNLTAGEAVAIKVTGNQSFLSLTLSGGPERSIEGVCLFMAGNQAEAIVTANVNLGALVYVGRGNLSNGHVTVGEGYQLLRSYVDLSGNQASLTIDGDGQFFCPVARQSGNGTAYSCQ